MRADYFDDFDKARGSITAKLSLILNTLVLVSTDRVYIKSEDENNNKEGLKMKKHVLAVLIGSSILLTACGGGDGGESTYVIDDGVPKNNIVAPVVKTTGYTDASQTADNLLASVSSHKLLMTYKMLGVNGKETQATALVFTPKTVKPAGGWPIVAWAHGTTGVADMCAPSQQGLKGNEYLIQGLLAAGYAVVAPDYEGLGEPSGREPHPFLNLKSEAFSITDAVVAARNYLGNTTENRWLVVGHSQGGQAALGAAQYASRAQLNYKGAIAVAPASFLGSVLTLGEGSTKNMTDPTEIIKTLASLDTFTSLITAGLKNQYPNLQYNQVFKSPTDLIAAKAESLCSDKLGDALGGAMGQYFQLNMNLTNYPRTQTDFMTNVPEVKDFLVNGSQPLKTVIKTPIIIYQGTLDPTVPRQVTDTLVKSAPAGTTISYKTDDALPETSKWDHITAYSLNLGNIVKDVQSLMPIQ